MVLTPFNAEAVPYGAAYVASLLSCLTPNQVKTHPITLTNTGDLNWMSQQPNPFNLSYHWYQGANLVVWDGLRTSLPNVVGGKNSALKNHVTLNADLQAPPNPGTYTLRWDMVHENVTWFSSQGARTGNQTVEVKSQCFTLGELCKQIDCGTLVVRPPKIEAVVPFISNITPGGYVAVKGSWFGNDEGELWLKGLKKWNGAAYGDVKLAIATEPGKDFWNTTSVFGVIPGNITQVKDQPVTLQIKTKAGAWSNEFPISFNAAKDWVTLTHTDPAVKLISCGTDSNKDVCNGKSDPDDGDWFSSSCGQTFYGFHYNVWGTIGDDLGTDQFEITLKNGWVIDGGKIHVFVDQGEGYTRGPGAVPSGVPTWKPSVQWNVTPDDSLCHGADVYTVGPKGVPWK
jgi:hypothetical protein